MVSIAVRFDSHCLCLPLAGVREPCDVALAVPSRIGLLVTIIDPIGQGRKALSLGRKAAQIIGQTPGAELVDLFARVHRSLDGFGGISLGAARIDPRRGQVEFASVGRVYGAVVGTRRFKLLTPEQGALGLGLPRIPPISSVPWTTGDLLILAADGLVDAWDLTKVRGAVGDPFEAIALRVGGYSARMPEDASLVLVRERG